MPVNRATLLLIQYHEGLRLEAYADPGYGWKIATIGYGHTTQAGPPIVTKGMRITTEEAQRILEADLLAVEVAVREAVKVPLNDNQFGALVSLTFNIGSGAFRRSTLLRKLNQRDYAGAADEFKRWNKSNGKVLPGLTLRRKAEAGLFQAPLMPVGKPRDEFPKVPATPHPAGATGFKALVLLLLTLIKKVFRK